MLGCDADSGTREGVLLMADLEGSLLPPKPESAINLRDASYRSSSASGRQPFRGVDVLGVGDARQSQGAELSRRRSRNFDSVFGNASPAGSGLLKFLWKLLFTFHSQACKTDPLTL
ncbi:hypothetical protein OIU77_017069 [Salix suchowensis]|uniref:Uncharacterized protein n=1 Tax=Salix suchowensis TaxID=1278906 RepID=A0ABQ8ZMQ6_9ROSI|nr:hypothetical protein OIU77_017069 [Salix suchowensis]